MNLTPNFTYEEATVSQTAIDQGINNTPPPNQKAHIQDTAEAMEHVRSELGNPIHINSWYRCAQLNSAVSGSTTSAHMEGYAVDFTCSGYGDPIDVVARLVKSGIKFDQCIQENHWVHISFDPRMRQQVMTAHFAEGQPTTYTKGA